MPSKNMLPKGKRRQSVRADYRAARDVATEAEQQRKRLVEAELYGQTATEAPVNSSGPEVQPHSPTDALQQARQNSSQTNGTEKPGPVPRRTKTFPARKPARRRDSTRQQTEPQKPAAARSHQSDAHAVHRDRSR